MTDDFERTAVKIVSLVTKSSKNEKRVASTRSRTVASSTKQPTDRHHVNLSFDSCLHTHFHDPHSSIMDRKNSGAGKNNGIGRVVSESKIHFDELVARALRFLVGLLFFGSLSFSLFFLSLSLLLSFFLLYISNRHSPSVALMYPVDEDLQRSVASSEEHEGQKASSLFTLYSSLYTLPTTLYPLVYTLHSSLFSIDKKRAVGHRTTIMPVSSHIPNQLTEGLQV